MRMMISWLFAVIAFFIINTSLGNITSKFNLVTYINYGEDVTVLRGDGKYEEFYEDEISGTVTDLGIFNIFLSIMMSWRIYHWILSGTPSGNIAEDKRKAWLYWIIGAFGYMAISHFLGMNLFAPWS